MPELPEVETVVRSLRPHLIGKQIQSVKVLNPRLRYPLAPSFAQQLTARTVISVTRRAKYICAKLDNGVVWLAHLGMSGRFRFQSDPIKHDHVHIEVGGRSLFYNDPRRFGFMDLVDAENLEQSRFFHHLGIEPLEEAFTASWLYEQCQQSSRPIKSLIMDQEVVVGVGNIYASEALWGARIHPMQASKSLSLVDCERLRDDIVSVLLQAIEASGSTLKDYRTPDDQLGEFQNAFRVYGRHHKPCQNACGSLIQRATINQRSTFFCPLCQQLK